MENYRFYVSQNLRTLRYSYRNCSKIIKTWLCNLFMRHKYYNWMSDSIDIPQTAPLEVQFASSFYLLRRVDRACRIWIISCLTCRVVLCTCLWMIVGQGHTMHVEGVEKFSLSLIIPLFFHSASRGDGSIRWYQQPAVVFNIIIHLNGTTKLLPIR